MQEVAMNHVRVFRRIERGSRATFEVRSFNGHTGSVHSTPTAAAQAVHAKATEHGHVAQVSIAFQPEHGMEWPVGERFAYRCVGLTPAEQHEFSEAFNAAIVRSQER